MKKPLEFVASALRTTGAEVQLSHQLLRYLGRMGEPKIGRSLLERLVPLRTAVLGADHVDTLASLLLD